MKILGIIMGSLLTISGIFCLTQPVLTFANLSWVIGAIVLACGICGLVAWWQGRKSGESNLWDMAGALLTTIVGVLMLCNFWAQLFTDMALIMLFGVWIVCAGVLRIVASVQLKFAWWGFGVFWGVVLILAGIYALLHPVVSLISLGWCVAFVFISQGINLVFAAISTKSENAA